MQSLPNLFSSQHGVSMPSIAEKRTGYHLLPRLTARSFAAGKDVCDTEVQATFKNSAADFRVDEQLPFSLSGEGEHLWLQISKKDLNTRDLMQMLARTAGCRLRDVGYSGLKDRTAVTTQWFSLPITSLPDRANNLAEILQEQPVFRDKCELLKPVSYTHLTLPTKA